MFKRLETGYCLALLLEPWNVEPGRFFTAYRARHGFNAVVGNGVVEEFRTTSAPLFICPSPLLGKIYDAGMLLAEERDIGAPLDQGWPPLCVGLDMTAPELNDDWKTQFLETLMGNLPGETVPWPVRSVSETADSFQMEVIRCGGLEPQTQVTVISSDAPLLPNHLERLADIDQSGLTVAIATGNRIERSDDGKPQKISVVSEENLASIERALRKALDAID